VISHLLRCGDAYVAASDAVGNYFVFGAVQFFHPVMVIVGTARGR